MICFTYLELDESIVALQQVNETVVRLVDLTDRLQMELDDITNQTMELSTNCTMRANATANPSLTVVCNRINVTSYMVVIDYANVSVLCVYMHACLYICVCIHAWVCV